MTRTAADVPGAAAPLSIEHLDPARLLLDVNIRTAAALDKDFLASVKDLGVLVPIIAVPPATGYGSGAGTAEPWLRSKPGTGPCPSSSSPTTTPTPPRGSWANGMRTNTAPR